MTDNDIIKGAEHCLNPKYACDDCPYTDTGEHQEECMAVLIKDLLSLINRQKAEIERLNKQNLSVVEHLKKARRQLKTAKADAIKDCMDMVKEKLRDVSKIEFQGGYYYLVGLAFFDNIIDELVGDTE